MYSARLVIHIYASEKTSHIYIGSSARLVIHIVSAWWYIRKTLVIIYIHLIRLVNKYYACCCYRLVEYICIGKTSQNICAIARLVKMSYDFGKTSQGV